MSDDNETVETPAEDVSAEDTTANEPSLDDLLADFGLTGSDETPNTQTETKPDPKEDFQEVVSYVRGEIAQKQESKSAADLQSAVESVKGDLDVDPEIVEGWLHAQASKDERLQRVWDNRDSNPSQWQKALSALGRDFEKRMSAGANKEVSEDVEAVAAAVRGASTKNPEPTSDVPDNIESMSDAQFERWVSSQSK